MDRTATLGALAQAGGDLLVSVLGSRDLAVSGLGYDSRLVAPGYLFFCVPGTTSDGHDFAARAVDAGAAALCVERELPLEVPQIVVSDVRRTMGRVAAEFYGHPSDALTLLGVTGTNGKTTTVFLLESILRAEVGATGLIGTIETRIGERVEPGVRTTPESLDLQKLFARMVDDGIKACAMEVTSHGLVLHRVEGVRFQAAAFTNLSQDHLDFHPGMEEYFEAKRSLFVPERLERGAVNIDDEYGRRLLERAEVPLLTFGMSDAAEVRAEDVRMDPSGTRFKIRTPKGDLDVSTHLIGAFNVSNCLAATAVALQAGIGLDAIERGLEGLRAVPGRFEVIDEGQPFVVVVDYAHTPDSLDNVLRAARGAARRGRVICLFGCGGDRDKGKRPLMGAVAASLADVVVVTSDNPRSEDPHAIIDQILEGVVAHRPEGPDVVDADRAEAMTAALSAGSAGDVVVIAGKGHETGQQFADRTIPFDDRDVARSILRSLGWDAS
ncbi:MAG TPA: UDP-N-acetylmuramoyl-L-alanyl-D-glutamate--2,6-diaminopimelate ligase [Actinomycetota bacterium]|nr:UDP-N-acetylmuramoyl-L-alanyl-D-glutamate--2,6-diaminopimelate ligase [Actinomycetota bacterium]